jgi:hypothetical protein
MMWVILVFGFLLWRRKQKGLYLPKASDEDVVFVERFASGYSHRSWITQMGGAANCLTIIVTESHFVTTTFFPFTAFAGFYDLEHLIPLTDITELLPNGRMTEIEFKRDDGTVCKLTLRLKDSAGFEVALKNDLKI